MPSKQIVDRTKSATIVSSAASVHAARVAPAIETILAPFLDQGQTMPDIAGFTLLVGKWLAHTSATMTATDEAHIHELSDDDPFRQARDQAQAALNDELVELREWMTGLFGARAVRSLGFAADTPRDPAALAHFAGEVTRSLREKTFPAPKRDGVIWVPAREADKIDSMRTTLDTALSDVAREVREAQGTLADKNTAIATYDTAFSRSAKLLEGLFTFAGETALADRVRPSARRAGQTEEQAPPAEPAAAEAPSTP